MIYYRYIRSKRARRTSDNQRTRRNCWHLSEMMIVDGQPAYYPLCNAQLKDVEIACLPGIPICDDTCQNCARIRIRERNRGRPS